MNENNDRALGSEMHVYCISQVREKRLDVTVTSSQNSAKSINELDQTDEIEPLKMTQTDDRPEESVIMKTLVIGGKTFMIGDKSQSQVGNRLAQA